MSDIGRTLDEVCTLIGRVKGCSAVRGSVEGEHAAIDLVGERAALMSLQDVLEAANANITPWLHAGDESAGAMATQAPRASVTRRDDLIAHGSLQLVGIHVVGDCIATV